MKSKEKLWEVCMEIYRESFKQATPSADFDSLIESGETKKENWFMGYYLQSDIFDEIVEQKIKEHKITRKYDKDSIRQTVYLGCSPREVKI